ncbi:transglycosylase family protein [Streptomyces sp. NPDC056682]|uniref:transglycosylase family protein n=1 Tax=Streptomyces sp. NPDC056682 TaxID=3345909 RepID=UPI003694B7BC
MRSGNGRHRRPRQAPALVVAAGVTGSAIALPLLAATGANAADASTWNQVATCESGGMWSADFGNGLYGGLQFSQTTWETYGGTDYAQRADLASRAQQIAVAEKVLAAQGPKAFGSCADGITKGGAAADVDPGLPATPDPADTPLLPTTPATKTPGTAPTPTTPTGSATTTPGGTQTADPAKPATPPASTPASPGKHRGAPSPEEGSGATPGPTGSTAPTGQPAPTGKPAPTGQSDSGSSSDSRDAGRASRGDGSSRDVGNTPAANGDYTVHPGDSLSAIATANKIQGGWPALYHANEHLIGTDPNLILPGQSLDLKAAAAAVATPNSVPKQG